VIANDVRAVSSQCTDVSLITQSHDGTQQPVLLLHQLTHYNVIPAADGATGRLDSTQHTHHNNTNSGNTLLLQIQHLMCVTVLMAQVRRRRRFWHATRIA